jgi:tetratricopeptide (TPR) repeat protein
MSGITKPHASPAAALIQQAAANLNRNNAEQAEADLQQALEVAPDDPNALQLMGAVRETQGSIVEAEHFYRRAIARDPLLPQAHHSLGNLLANQGLFDASTTEQREAIRLRPNFVQAHLSLALALSALGDHESAAGICSQALRLQPNYLSARQLLAAELNALNRPKEAEKILRQLLSLGIADAHVASVVEHNLGISLNMQNRFEEALPCFEAACTRNPGAFASAYGLGDTLQRLGRLDDALAAFRRAVALDPESVDALSFAALIAARVGDGANVRSFGQRALALSPGNCVAQAALAIAELDDGDVAAASQRIRLVLDDPAAAGSEQTYFAMEFVASALERHGLFSLAFDVYARSNAWRRQKASATFDGARIIDEVGRLTSYFVTASRWPASKAGQPSNSAASRHVFVLGFMRSGTTLMTAALAGHPDVAVSDEKELLRAPAAAFLLDDAGLRRLERLDDAEMTSWQNIYWEAARAGGLQGAGKAFVDKMPFNSLRLPLLARLFPAAKVIFALRDPRDVVLSCFRRRFDLTPFSFEFLGLEDCARFYSSVMTLVERYREKLPLEVLDFRYEQMVSEYEPSMRAACEFIQLGWHDSMRDFSAGASGIDRRSASAAQVRQALYRDAVGQWRHYREQLAPVLPILEPWVKRFGYPAE